MSVTDFQPRIKLSYFWYKYVIQLAILQHLHLHHFCHFSYSIMIKSFFFFLQHKIYTLKLIVALNFLLSRHDICFRSFFSFFRADFHSTNVTCLTNTIFNHAIFNLHFRRTKWSVYLTNLFCLLTISSY